MCSRVPCAAEPDPSCNSKVPCVHPSPGPRALPCGQALVVTFLDIFDHPRQALWVQTERVFGATFGFRWLEGGGRDLLGREPGERAVTCDFWGKGRDL